MKMTLSFGLFGFIDLGPAVRESIHGNYWKVATAISELVPGNDAVLVLVVLVLVLPVLPVPQSTSSRNLESDICREVRNLRY